MEEGSLLKQRKEKAKRLREEGIELFPRDFKVDATTEEIRARYGGLSEEELKGCQDILSCAGRILSMRDFGRAVFSHIQDRKGRIQLYFRRDVLGEEAFRLYKRLDIGDFIGVSTSIKSLLCRNSLIARMISLLFLKVSFTWGFTIRSR